MTKVLAWDQAMAVSGWAFGTENSSPREGANDRYHYGAIKNPKREDPGERLAFLWREVEKLIDRFEPDLICIEEPYFPIQGQGGAKKKPKYGKGAAFIPASGFLDAEVNENQEDTHEEKSRFNPEMLKQLQMVKGLIITQSALRGIPCIGCTPSQWRKTVLGFGRAPKGSDADFMKKRVKLHFKQLGFDVSGSHDVTDALGILIHSLHGPEASQRRQGDLLSMAGGLL